MTILALAHPSVLVGAPEATAVPQVQTDQQGTPTPAVAPNAATVPDSQAQAPVQPPSEPPVLPADEAPAAVSSPQAAPGEVATGGEEAAEPTAVDRPRDTEALPFDRAALRERLHRLHRRAGTWGEGGPADMRRVRDGVCGEWRYEMMMPDGSWLQVWPEPGEEPQRAAPQGREHRYEGAIPGVEHRLRRHRPGEPLRDALPDDPFMDDGVPYDSGRGYDGPWPWETKEGPHKAPSAGDSPI